VVPVVAGPNLTVGWRTAEAGGDSEIATLGRLRTLPTLSSCLAGHGHEAHGDHVFVRKSPPRSA